jgi:putative beta-barrel porin BBP2
MRLKHFSLMAAMSILFLTASHAVGYQATFTPSISISEEYTDNMDLTNNDEEYEYITSISPGFSFQVFEKTYGASLFYSPSYVHYDRFPENNTWRQNASFSGWSDLSKHTKLTISDTFVRTEDPASEEDRTIRRSREPYYTNSSSVGLDHKISKSDSIALRYLYSFLENTDPEIEDNERHSPSITYSHKFSPYLALDTNVSYNRGQFETTDDFDNWNGSLTLANKFTKYLSGSIRYSHTIMDYRGDTEDYKIYDPSIGINYTITEDTFLSLNVGYFIQDRENSDDESGLTLTGSLGKTWEFKRGSINATGSSGYEESYFGSENLGFNRYYEAQASANYRLTKSLTGNIFGSFRRNKYVNQDDNRTDKLKNAGAGLTFNPITIRWLHLSLNYSYNTVDSTEKENEYDENRVLLSITLSPPNPIPLK